MCKASGQRFGGIFAILVCSKRLPTVWVGLGKLLTGLVVALGLLALGLPAQAATLDVCPSGCTYATIQSAIDAAVSGVDTVRVGDGIYTENINFSQGKALTVQSDSWVQSSLNTKAIIDGSCNTNPVVTFEGSDTSTLQGFTIRSGCVQNNGGGIYCNDASPTILNNLIDNNIASANGGGIFCSALSQATISSNTITSNQAAFGGGIATASPSTSIRNNIISSNTAGIGGGIIDEAGSSTIYSNRINNNIASSNGGGIYCKASSSKVSKNTIRANMAANGGGIYAYEDNSLIYSNNTISANTATGNGGGIYCTGLSFATISSNTITSNNAGSGGGIYCYDASMPDIGNNLISSNTATDDGGGIFCFYYSYPDINKNTISNNSANNGGGIYCGDSSYHKTDQNLIDNNPIDNNLINSNTATNRGGGIYCANRSSPNVDRNTIRNNSAVNGGGVYCAGSSSPKITNALITLNDAVLGDGMYLAQGSDLWIINNTIADNLGDGIYVDFVDTDVVIINSILWSNGDDLTPSPSTTIRYCNIEDRDGEGTNGNISADPVFETNYILSGTSPCIDAGTASFAPVDDIIGSTRPQGLGIDIGADEYVWADTEDNNIGTLILPAGDGLPDKWEEDNFGGILAYGPDDDPDGDGHTNLEEYKMDCDPNIASSTIAVPANYPSIQAAIDVAGCGDRIIVNSGIYTENITFNGKAITVRGSGINTILDGDLDGDGVGNGSVVTFNLGEGSYTKLDGFVIKNGNDEIGGGIAVLNGSAPTIINNFIYSNTAEIGGGIGCRSAASPTIMNNTIVNNTATNRGGGISATNASFPKVTNTILWDDTILGGSGEEIYLDNTSSISVRYSDIDADGGAIYYGTGNTSWNPYFVDPANRDYHLQSDENGSSICINSGTDEDVPEYDIDRNARTMGGVTDIGADEYIPPSSGGVSGGGAGGGGCFIATAAYETPLAKQVQILSRFRDRYLLNNKLGSKFVEFYYQHSPPIARYIADRPYLRVTISIGLWPLIGFSWLMLMAGWWQKLVLLLAVLGVCSWWLTSRQKIKLY